MTRNFDDPRWNLLVNVIAASAWVGERRRARLLRRAGMRVHPDARVQHGFWFYGSAVGIGARAWINHGCYFDSRAPIEIAENAAIGQQVMICTSTHDVGPPERRTGPYREAPVAIGRGCWIGSRAVILPGVTVGEGCIVAAGAVVTRDCDANGLYAGVPARRLRDLPG